MKEKVIATLLVFMAGVLATTAVINLAKGDVLGAVPDLLIAVSDIIIAWVLMRQEFIAKVVKVVGNHHFDLIKQLEKGVPATLHIVRKDNDDDEGDEIPEDELTEDEKRVKRMAEEYDQLAGRLQRLTAFRDTDTYKALPENKRTLLDRQCRAMDDYESALKERLKIESSEANKGKD